MARLVSSCVGLLDCVLGREREEEETLPRRVDAEYRDRHVHLAVVLTEVFASYSPQSLDVLCTQHHETKIWKIDLKTSFSIHLYFTQ